MHVRSSFGWLVLFVLPACALAQTTLNPARLPKFDEFHVEKVFKAKPQPPKIVRPNDRLFRTCIREAAANGPNFAGHYTIAVCGCGSGCITISLIDAMSGDIYESPFRKLAWGMPILTYEGRYAPNVEGFHPLEYRLNSKLLIARGCPEYAACASLFYEWTGSSFKLLRKVVAHSRELD